MRERSAETGRFLKRQLDYRKKVCTGCGEKKYLKEFYKLSVSKNHPDGYDCRCKLCRRKEKNDSYARTKKIPDGIKLNSEGILVEKNGMSVRLYWGEMKVKDFKRRFPFEKNEDLAIDFCCSPRTVVRRAREMGLEKDPRWLYGVWDKMRRRAHRINRAFGNKADLTNFKEGGKPYRFKKKTV